MGKKQKSSSSLRSKAVHFVTDLTTGLLNPISAPPLPVSFHLFCLVVVVVDLGWWVVDN